MYIALRWSAASHCNESYKHAAPPEQRQVSQVCDSRLTVSRFGSISPTIAIWETVETGITYLTHLSLLRRSRMFIALVTVRGGAPAERDVHQPTHMLLLTEQNTSIAGWPVHVRFDKLRRAVYKNDVFSQQLP